LDLFITELRTALKLQSVGLTRQASRDAEGGHANLDHELFAMNSQRLPEFDTAQASQTCQRVEALRSYMRSEVSAQLDKLGVSHLDIPLNVLQNALHTRIDQMMHAIEDIEQHLPTAVTGRHRAFALPQAHYILSFEEYLLKKGVIDRELERVKSLAGDIPISLGAVSALKPEGLSALNLTLREIRGLFQKVCDEVETLLANLVWRFRPDQGYHPERGDQIHEAGRSRVLVSGAQATEVQGVFRANTIERRVLEFEYKTDDQLVLDPAFQAIHRGGGVALDTSDEAVVSDALLVGSKLVRITPDGSRQRGEVLGSEGGMRTILWYTKGLPTNLQKLSFKDTAKPGALSQLGIFHEERQAGAYSIKGHLLKHLSLGKTLSKAELEPLFELTDTSEPLAGLEGLLERIMTARLPIYVRVCGDVRDRNFDGPVEPRWIRQVDGFLATACDAVALVQTFYRMSEEESGDEFLDRVREEQGSFIGADSARLCESAHRFLSGHMQTHDSRDVPSPVHPKLLGQTVVEHHTTDGAVLTRGEPVVQKIEDLLTLGTVLNKNGCSPVVVCFGGDARDAQEIAASINAGWDVVLVRNSASWDGLQHLDAADKAIARVEQARISDPSTFPKVHIIECDWNQLNSLLLQLGAESSQRMSEVILPTPQPRPTSEFIARLRDWCDALEQSLASDAQRVSDYVLEQRRRTSLPAERANEQEQFALLCRSLRDFHNNLERFLKHCQAHSIYADEEKELAPFDGPRKDSFALMRGFLAEALRNPAFSNAALKMLDEIEQEYNLFHQRFSVDTCTPRHPSSFETSTTGLDLVRIAHIMEMSNYGLHGPAGPIHGFLYGDMSRDRFAEFVSLGARLHTVRIGGQIVGFFLDAAPAFLERYKPDISGKFDASGKTAIAIAIALDPRSGSVDPVIYEKVRNSAVLHQMRSTAVQIGGRVHPRNVRALSAHACRGGFQLSSVADEDVGPIRFVSMYMDLHEVQENGIPAETDTNRAEALERAFDVFFEEMRGRGTPGVAEREALLVEGRDLLQLVRLRLALWTLYEGSFKKEWPTLEIAQRKQFAAELLAALGERSCAIRPDSIDRISAAMDALLADPDDAEAVNALSVELSVALGQRRLLQAYEKALLSRLAH
jgi:hypothetical protein